MTKSVARKSASSKTYDVLPGQLSPRPDLYEDTDVEPFVQVKTSIYGDSAESAIDVTNLQREDQ